MFDTMTEAHARQNGLVLAEGKTKIIAKNGDDTDNVHIISKDDITAGDGAKHDLIQGKAVLATQTTCNVFRLLKACGIPVAFTEQVNSVTFSAPLCTMLPYEVVIRRSTWLIPQANARTCKRSSFSELIVEFFLKTSGKKWKNHDLLCDDPLMQYTEDSNEIALYEASKPIHSQKPFLILKESEVFRNKDELLFEEMKKIAKRVFLILEKAWQLEWRTLVDFKIEFGLSKNGALLLADVIDNDSWRVMEDGEHIDKQAYRDGGKIDEVAEKYRHVAEITGHFRLPKQQIVVWRGSSKDEIGPVVSTIDALCKKYPEVTKFLKLRVCTCSIHKEPIRGLEMLHSIVQQIPDTVLIAYIGRSNGAGPTLSASTTIPVITTPASFKEFPDDVWSSLRTPSNVPVTTVLEPSNAALAALEILALRNPLLYMFLREPLEERLVNTILI